MGIYYEKTVQNGSTIIYSNKKTLITSAIQQTRVRAWNQVKKKHEKWKFVENN